MNNKIELNIFPFLINALAIEPAIYKDIDELYNKDKYVFYELAKNDDLYNHNLLTDGSLLIEEYSKKLLGIISFISKEYEDEELQSKNEEYIKGLFGLCRKGYNYAYQYINKHNKIDLHDYMRKYHKKNKGVKNISVDRLNAELVMLLFLVRNDNKKELIENDIFIEFMKTLKEILNHSEGKYGINMNNLSPQQQININKLLKLINNTFGEITIYDNLIEVLYRKDNKEYNSFDCGLSLMYDLEGLSSYTIHNNIKITENEIKEIIVAYRNDKYAIKEIELTKEAEEDFIKYFISALHIRFNLKAYNIVKQHYFKNNKETMFIELDKLENENMNINMQVALLKRDKNKLVDEISIKEKENERLRKEIEQLKQGKNELDSLREFIFNLDKQEEYREENIDYDKLKNSKGLIIGGHNKWQDRMKELLPNYIFIHPDNMNFDIRLLDSIDNIFVYTNYLNHGLYYKIISNSDGKNIYYINNSNEDIVLKEIYKRVI